MKRAVLFLMMLGFLASCSDKSDDSISTDKTYQASIKVDGFKSTLETLKSDVDTYKSMTYYLYKDDVMYQKKHRTADFDGINMTLLEGHYKLIVFYNETGTYTSWIGDQSDSGWYRLGNDVGDLFWSTVEFDIIDQDIVLDPIVLNRINSNVTISLSNIPEEVTSVSFSCGNTDLAISPTLDFNNAESFQAGEMLSLSFDVQDEYSINIMPLKDALVTIDFYKNEEIINTMELNNISVKRNQKLTLAGEYSEDGNFDVDITIEKNWDNESDGSF